MADYLWNMASKKTAVRKGAKPSAEGKAMDRAFKLATKKALKEAFKVRRTIMIERDGWLVMVNKAGKVVRRVKRLSKPEVAGA